MKEETAEEFVEKIIKEEKERMRDVNEIYIIRKIFYNSTHLWQNATSLEEWNFYKKVASHVVNRLESAKKVKTKIQ